MAWFYLIVGGLFEIGFTTSLRYVDGFKNQLTAQGMPPLLVETYSTAAERLPAGDVGSPPSSWSPPSSAASIRAATMGTARSAETVRTPSTA